MKLVFVLHIVPIYVFYLWLLIFSQNTVICGLAGRNFVKETLEFYVKKSGEKLIKDCRELNELR
jgi:hypothetical protein